MLKNLFKRTLLNKATTITFSVFLFLNIGILGFIMYKAVRWGAGSDSFSKATYLAFFWSIIIEFLIISVLIRGVIFDSDINYLIKVEKQYNISIWKIYFYRVFIKFIYCITFVTVLLLFYFIFYFAMFKSAILAKVFLTSSVGYVAYLYLFCLLPIFLSSITTYIKNATFRFAIPFLISFFFLGVSMSSSIFLFMNETGQDKQKEFHYQTFLGYEKDFENYLSFSNQITQNDVLSTYLIGKNGKDAIIHKTDYSSLNDNDEARNNNDELKKLLHSIFNNRDIDLGLKGYHSDNYNFILKQSSSDLFTPGTIDYKASKDSISDLFKKLAIDGNGRVKELQKYSAFFNELSKIYKDYEKNNIFSLYTTEISSDGDSHLFLGESDFVHSQSYKLNPLEYAIDYYIDKAQIYCKCEINDDIKIFYENNFDYYANYLRKTAYLNPYFQIYFLTMNKSLNYEDDLNRASYIGGGAPITRLKHYTFTKVDDNQNIKDGDKIKLYKINSDPEMTTYYNYSVTVFEYIVLLVGLSLISYGVFVLKNKG